MKGHAISFLSVPLPHVTYLFITSSGFISWGREERTERRKDGYRMLAVDRFQPVHEGNSLSWVPAPFITLLLLWKGLSPHPSSFPQPSIPKPLMADREWVEELRDGRGWDEREISDFLFLVFRHQRIDT